MRALFTTPLIGSLLLVSGCMGDGQQAASAETRAGLDKALAGLVPGTPTSCLPPQALSSVNTHAYGNVLLYKMSNGDVYRNDTDGGCNTNGDDIFVQVEYEGRPCSGDIVRTVDRNSHFPTGSCGLRDFTPYLKPRR